MSWVRLRTRYKRRMEEMDEGRLSRRIFRVQVDGAKEKNKHENIQMEAVKE